MDIVFSEEFKKELEQIPDELLPEIARILDAIKKEHVRKPK